jgi:YidC/Oxa1 family membrane protein insertase
MEQKQDLDKNAIIGLVLIVLIVLGFVYMNQPSQEEVALKKHIQDSTELASKKEIKQQIVTPVVDSASIHVADSITLGSLSKLSIGESKTVTIENEEIKLSISSKGGRPILAQLKKYKKFDKKSQVTLLNNDNSRFDYSFNTTENKAIQSNQLIFDTKQNNIVVSKNSDSIVLTSSLNDKQFIQHIYTLPAKGFNVGMSIRLVGFEGIVAANSNSLNLNWNVMPEKQEARVQAERDKTTIYYKINADEPADNLGERKDAKEDIKTPLKWVSFKQQYFNTTLIAKSTFADGSVLETKTLGSDSLIKDLSATLFIPYNHKPDERFDMNLFLGPNHFQTLEKENIGLERIIYLGWGIFGYVNRFVVIPVFNFLDDYILSYGIIILLLTLIIKTVLFPLVFKSFKSTAKMRVLKPEVDQLKEKYGSDFQKQQSETMALYRKAGVNPLGGCFPMLLQLPILFAMFQFFPSAFELRQQSFLWASDLSMFDSIWDFGYVPIINTIYGDHVSLFTLLMTVSSIIFTMMNNQMTGASGQMKYIGLLMPVIFLGFFNNYASGLTWYYFLSNLITILQQLLIRRFIDEKALHASIQENKKKPIKKSGFQQKLEDMAKKRGIDPNQLKSKK